MSAAQPPALNQRELMELELKIMKRIERALAELPDAASKKRVADYVVSLTQTKE